METTIRRHRFRAYPSPDQEQALARAFGCARVAFNDVIAYREQARRDGLPYPSNKEVSRRLTESKRTPERAWLVEVSSVVLQQAVADANSAYKNFFASITGARKGRRMGAPRFKKRGNRQAIRFTRNAGYKLREIQAHRHTRKAPPSGQGFDRFGQVRLPGIGWVKFVLSRPMPVDPSSVTVVREPSGRYYLSFTVQVEKPEATAPVHDRGAGIDLGLKDFAAIVYTDGTREKIPNPRFLKKQLRKLRTAQKEHARRQKGSANREKSRAKVARLHERVASARQDHHDKLSTRLIRENQAVAVETLSITGLGRTRLAKSVYDTGWGLFLAMLAYKAEAHDRGFTAIGRYEPTSKTCSHCGTKRDNLPLKVRVWQCASCGAWLDRDYNAAVNINVAAGQAQPGQLAQAAIRETLNACGGAISQDPGPARTREAGTTPNGRTLAAA